MAGMHVHFLTGAPGAGKSAIADLVATRLANFVVLDMDLLLDAAGALSGVDLRDENASAAWPAYNDLWLRLVAAIARTHPVLLLTPLTPAELDRAPAGHELGPITWAALDCSDEVRRDRLADRGYSALLIGRALADAVAIRSIGLHTISTETETPDQTADRVARWALI